MMKFEQAPNKKESLDSDIYEKYQSIDINTAKLKKIEEYDLQEQKNLFIKGEIDSPHFIYKNLEKENLKLSETKLLELKQELKDSRESNPELNQAYIWKINERIAQVRMFQELQLLQNTQSPEHAKRYQRYAEFIYGKPDSDIFIDIIQVIEKNALDIDKEKLSQEQQESFKELQKIIQETKKNIISTKDFNNIRPNNPKDHGETISNIDDVKTMFEKKLQELNLDNEWKIIISEKDRSSFAIKPKSQQVILPNQKGIENRDPSRALTPEMIQGLIEHEIGTHALRKNNAQKGRFKLLEIGLDRYEEGEEGLATYREQQQTGAVDFAGLENYLTAGLAYGLDSGDARNFGEVFKKMTDYYLLFKTNEPEKAQELAWIRCLRIFKGAPGNIPGLISLKDTVYRKGNIATYELMKKDGSEKIDFNIGKYDPTNTRHIQTLVKLGILDQDLENLTQ